MRRLGSIGLMVALAAGCAQPAPATAPADAAKPAAAKLNVRPDGDTEIQPDLAQVPPEVQKVFAYIDEHIDEHVENLQKWIRQPSISNSGEGIPESAEMVKGFFDELGCQQTQIFDVGVTEYGSPGNPVVYAKCDEGAEKTLMIYWMYDTMPVTQPDAWTSPPFEGRLVEQAPYKKVLIGRGATNSKGPQMSQLNAFRAIKAVHGKLPVNLIFVAEGDEERMDIGLRKFVKDHPELLAGADAMLLFGGQSPGGSGSFGGGSEGCVYVELTTSGKSWGRGPTVSDIHGSYKRSVDSPAWRHIKMLASLVSDDGNTPLIEGFHEGRAPIDQWQDEELKTAAQKTEMKVAADNVGVARYISEDPYTMLKMQRFGTSFNLDGIWGGNMYAGGAGAILPNKVTSKHNFRYVPNMKGPDIVKKLRAQLDKNGYKDVEVKMIGDVPWAKMNTEHDAGRALKRAYEVMNIPHGALKDEWGIGGGGAAAGGYWPAYLFGNGDVGEKVSSFAGVPIVGGGGGHGGGAHAANEWYVIEGAGKIYGMAGAEKVVAAMAYAFAGKIPPGPAKSTTN
ncbi:MAG TPA: M20/M25/M40 family metallo-hydrolase [Vicinamibacterales bacterium]|nr:M20/M25/M40 family metallo-hydrolase [Vicinamibacterales bacterium]